MAASWDEIEFQLKALLLASMGGCVDSYRQFLDRLTPLLRRYFGRRLSQQWADVEDLTQEVLLAVHRQRHTYDEAYPLTAWVHAMARHKLVDFYRRNARQPECIELEEADESFAGDAASQDDEPVDWLALLDQLPGGQRDAIRMVKLEGWSVREASKMTGQSESSVKVNIHRGIKKLSSYIRGHVP